MSEDTELAPEPVNLAEALKQMDDDGNPPVGFHMMFFSSDFKNSENCPTLQLLKMLGAEYNFADTIKRQVFQMPKDLVIMSYEFAWLGGFEGLQEAMEGINKILEDQFRRMVENKSLNEIPQARISFLAEQPDYKHDCCAEDDCEHKGGEEE
tara:strand:- start:235 stop:690 length:456 start_codon:yes stop_codon:yes gene_type:complete